MEWQDEVASIEKMLAILVFYATIFGYVDFNRIFVAII